MGLDELSADISKAYDDLRTIEDSIINLSGKERFGAGRRRMPETANRFDDFGFHRRDVTTSNAGFTGATKRRLVVSAENDLYEGLDKRIKNGDKDNEVRRTVQSSIVMPAIETKSREAAISELKGHEKKEVNVRNRRMFSNLLLGTLQRFQKEEKQVFSVEKVQAEKQREVEKRLKETEVEERERLAKERATLLEKRREKERLIKSLQRKKAVIQYAEQKQDHYRKLQNFIQTRAKPPIFYLPSKHTLRTLELLKVSTKQIDDLIEHRRKQMETDLMSPNVKHQENIESDDGQAVVQKFIDTTTGSSDKELFETTNSGINIESDVVKSELQIDGGEICAMVTENGNAKLDLDEHEDSDLKIEPGETGKEDNSGEHESDEQDDSNSVGSENE